MVEQIQLNKIRQKRREKINDNRSTDRYFYPKDNLYSREEFELLDTIYSDESPTLQLKEQIKDPVEMDSLPQHVNKQTINLKLRSVFTNIGWFLGGIALASLAWFIFLQTKISELQTDSIKIVFHKSAPIITDKTVDTEVTNALTNGNAIALASIKKEDKPFFFNLFGQKSKDTNPTKTETSNSEQATQLAENKSATQGKPSTTYHVIKNGDSLWLIAKEYYGNPSPTNIRKIQEANGVGSYLYPGKKLIIPL